MFTRKKYYHQCDRCNSAGSQLKWLLTGFTTVLTCLLIMSLLLASACFSYLVERVSATLFSNIMWKNYLRSRDRTQIGRAAFLLLIRSKAGQTQLEH